MKKKELIEFLQECDSDTVLVRKEEGAVPIARGWVSDGEEGEKIIILEI